MGPMPKRLLILLAVGLVLGSLMGLTDFAGAQTMTIETVPPEVDESGRTARERVDGVVLILRILAGLVLMGTAAFWWHTRPVRTFKKEDPMNSLVQTEPTGEHSPT